MMTTSYTHFKNRVGLLRSYLKKEKVANGLPINAIVESTARCNLFCPMCPREIVDMPDKDLAMDDFQKLVDEGAATFEYVAPIGLGEPLLKSDIYEMIGYARQRNIRVGLSTNATVLDEIKGKKLIDSDLDYLILAVDGTTSEVYEQYRKGAKYEIVLRNIRNFLRLKTQLKSKMHVVMQMIRMPHTQHQVKEYKKIWSGVPGVDEVRIKEDETKFPGVGLPPEHSNGRIKNPCHYIWQGPIYMRYDGAVFPCCHFYRNEPIGNIKQNTLPEIWNSEAMQRLREAHIRGDISAYPDCVHCHAAKPRKPVIIGSFLLDYFKVRRWIPFFERLALFFRVPIFRKTL